MSHRYAHLLLFTVVFLSSAISLRAGETHPSAKRPSREENETYVYQVRGTSSQSPQEDRAWSKTYNSESLAQKRKAEIERDHAKGGILEFSPDKPRKLYIAKFRTSKPMKAGGRDDQPSPPVGGGRPAIVLTQAAEIQAESNRLQNRSAELKRERERLEKNEAWLNARSFELRRDAKAITNRSQMLANRIANFRCPNGYTLGGCYSRPPVCSETQAFRAWCLEENEQIKSLQRRLNVAGSRLKEQQNSYITQLRSYSRQLSQLTAEATALQSRIASMR